VSVDRRILCFCASLSSAVLVGAAQAPQAPASNDPRVGLKAGVHDAGQAARGMELVTTLGKPKGFEPAAPAPGAAPADGGRATMAASLAFANSDIAFRKADLFLGNFHGFNTYDIETPKKTRLLASVVCPGGQGDMSVYGNLLFMSVEQTNGRVDCGTEGVQQAASPDRFRGVRIFDISDINNPRQVAAIQTCRGSHTHTLVADPKDPANIYVYGQGTSSVRSGDELGGCSSGQPDQDPNTALYSIDVIQVPLAHPEQAHIVSRPRIFADPNTGAIAGLQKAGERGPDAQPARQTDQCHDITAYPAIGLAAGACSGNGILLDISDPAHPVRIDASADKNFAYWHSATFNNDGTKVIFTDEWGGGTQPRCRASDPLNWGGDAIFDIVGRKLVFRSYYKMPAAQTDTENCVAHNGALIPVPGRDIMAQAWYQGGVSVFDFTDSAHPKEIAYFDRGPIDAKQLVIGGYWSAYWYNGRIYGSEIARGLDVFKLLPTEYMTQNEIDAASAVNLDVLNVQEQPKIVWPDVPAVALAYLDQLTRDNAIDGSKASAIKSAVQHADRKKLETLAASLDQSAAAASGIDQTRMKDLAETMRGLKK
jgi:hypothetical protein